MYIELAETSYALGILISFIYIYKPRIYDRGASLYLYIHIMYIVEHGGETMVVGRGELLDDNYSIPSPLVPPTSLVPADAILAARCARRAATQR